MAGILDIAGTSLNAFQRAFDVTSNNIANSSNRAYSRQTVNYASLPSLRYGTSYIGTGVEILDIKRHSDRFANEQVRETLTTKTQYEVFYQQTVQIDKLLSLEGTSLSTNLQNFFNAFNQLNSTPDSLASRQLTLQQSNMLTEQFTSMQSRLDEYQRNNNEQIQQITNQINQITTNIAQVNAQLTASPRAPELLDMRDELLRDLAKYTEITILDQGDAGISVAIGNGSMLVMGSEQRNLSVQANQYGEFSTQILIDNGLGQIDITASMNTGMIGGLLNYETEILSYGSQLIGQMAIGLATAFNRQHELGVNMNDQIGGAFFTDYNSASLQTARVLPYPSNTGTGNLSVAISDIGQTQLSEYQLVVTDAATNQVNITRKSDGTTISLTWTNTPPAPPAGQISLDGMTITVDDLANLATNDSFTLVPMSGAARDLALNITDPRAIALASPVRIQTPLTNTGVGNIALGQVFTSTDVTKEYSIQFISATEYNLVDVTDSTTTGPFTFTPSEENTVMIPSSTNPSYSVVISGVPNTGDSFMISFNAGGFGDNRNGLLLAGLQQSQIFSGGTENIFNRYSDLITQVAGTTYEARIGGDAADVLYQQAVDFRDSKSAVNLDEEAANLLRYEQAYQAASKLMAVSNQVMNILFDALR